MSYTTQLNVERLSEETMLAWIKQRASELVGVGFEINQSENDKYYAILIVKADSQGESPRGSGIHRMRVDISFEARAGDVSEDQLSSWWSVIMGQVWWDALDLELSTINHRLFVYPRSVIRMSAMQQILEETLVRSITIEFRAIERAS